MIGAGFRGKRHIPLVLLVLATLAILAAACSKGVSEGREGRWPPGFNCAATVILHTDSVFPDDEGNLDLSVARQNIAAEAALLKEFPQVIVTAAFPTSEWEVWPDWQDSGVQFAEVVGHSHTHHASIMAAAFGDQVVGELEFVYFDELSDLVFDADYALMNYYLNALVGSTPRRGYIAPYLRHTPHMIDVYGRDGILWYTTDLAQPNFHDRLVDLGSYPRRRADIVENFAQDCAEGKAAVIHFHSFLREHEMQREVLQTLVTTEGVWFASATDIAAIYAAVEQE